MSSKAKQNKTTENTNETLVNKENISGTDIQRQEGEQRCQNTTVAVTRTEIECLGQKLSRACCHRPVIPNLGGRTRRLTNSRSVWATKGIKGQLGNLVRSFLQK